MRSIAERNSIVEKNYGLVGLCVKQMNHGRFDEDLFQVGCIGLIRAAEQYDETRAQFSTYAAIAIKGELIKYLSKKLKKVKENEVSGDAPIIGTNLTLFDMIQDENDFSQCSACKLTMEQIVSNLNERDREVFELMKVGKTQKQIVGIIGQSQPQISRIRKRIKLAVTEAL